MIGDNPHCAYDWREDDWCEKHQHVHRKGEPCEWCLEDAILLHNMLGICIASYNDSLLLKDRPQGEPS